MRTSKWGALVAGLALIASAGAAAAQPCGMGAGMGMGRGMAMRGGPGMGMARDSATHAQMQDIHLLVMNHDRITRTVTNLPDGVRAVTESSDPGIAKVIRAHVEQTAARVAKRDDMNMPMESPALRTLFRNGDRIRTKIDSTATGIMIVQTSSDPETVAALQQHAAEVSDLVKRGRVAMHEAMMKNRGMR